jgi:hypothetical protein
VAGGLSGSIKKCESYLEDILGRPIHTTAELQMTAILGIAQAYILRKIYTKNSFEFQMYFPRIYHVLSLRNNV